MEMKPMNSQIIKLNDSPGEQENNKLGVAALVTPRGLSKSTSANLVLSHQKTKEIEDRKNRIMVNKDLLQKHVELVNRARQNIVR